MKKSVLPVLLGVGVVLGIGAAIVLATSRASASPSPLPTPLPPAPVPPRGGGGGGGGETNVSSYTYGSATITTWQQNGTWASDVAPTANATISNASFTGPTLANVRAKAENYINGAVSR